MRKDNMKEDIVSLPDKRFYKIGEVASFLNLETYVLRFWEKEFEILNPKKNRYGQRVYQKGDIETVLYIKRLLYKERYSIEGAKKRILIEKKNKGGCEIKGDPEEKDKNLLNNIKSELNNILSLLKDGDCFPAN